MNLSTKLKARAEAGRPVRVALIGAGKFGSMFLAQAPRTPGLHVAGIADLAPVRAREALARTGWPTERYAATSLAEAVKRGSTFVTDDAASLIVGDGMTGLTAQSAPADQQAISHTSTDPPPT